MAEYFIRKSTGKVLGPVTTTQVRMLAEVGSILPGDSLSKARTGPWTDIANVKNLFNAVTDAKESQPAASKDESKESDGRVDVSQENRLEAAGSSAIRSAFRSPFVTNHLATFKCPACKTRWSYSRNRVGERTSCEKCGESVVLPAPNVFAEKVLPNLVGLVLAVAGVGAVAGYYKLRADNARREANALQNRADAVLDAIRMGR